MEKFKIDTRNEKISSVNQTIRVRAEQYDQLVSLSEKTGVSFNKIVNQCIEYALRNMEEETP